MLSISLTPACAVNLFVPNPDISKEFVVGIINDAFTAPGWVTAFSVLTRCVLLKAYLCLK